jgi:two-component system KDP operon response regulator KdpE
MSRRISVLVVDDEPRILRFVRAELESDGYRVLAATSGRQGIDLHETERPALVILDLMMPDMDGFDVLRRIRVSARTPVIVLTARASDVDKIRGLDLGADDYLTKPFGVGELLARMRAALRRAGGARPAGQAVLEHGDLRMDLERREVTVSGRPVHLTPKEYDLLHYLLAHVGKLVTHGALLRAVWGTEYGDARPYLHVYVGQLRRKLEPDPSRPRHIVTEPGVGYRLADP